MAAKRGKGQARADGKRLIATTVPEAFADRLNEMCGAQGYLSISEMLRDLLRKEVARHDEEQVAV